MDRPTPIPERAINQLRQAGLRPPHMLTIAVTGACNLQCRHCWVDGGLPASAGHVPMTTLYRVMNEFAQLGGAGLRLTGGEPLCHPEWETLLHFARSRGFSQLCLQTNGNLIKKPQAAVLREIDFPGLNIQVSLDGASAATHDLIRGPGAFAGALAGLKALIHTGLASRLSLFFTEMRHNLEEIPALLKLADELGIPAVTTGALVRCGRARADDVAAPAEVKQYLALLDRYDSDPRFRKLYRRIGSSAALEWRVAPQTAASTCTFVENPYLTADGKLYPCLLCHADSHAVAGVFKKSLAAAFTEGVPLWTSLLQISRHRASSIPQCQDCADLAACGAGCPGRAWGSCGDFQAVEDRCALRRAIYLRKKNKFEHS